MYKKNKTKIVATLGPSCRSTASIVDLIDAGMDVARINLSHGDRQTHAEAIQTVKQARQKRQNTTAILLDTRGPEIRIGELDNATYLSSGDTVVLCCKEASDNMLPVNYDKLAEDVTEGDIILLDDGKMRLQVIGTSDNRVTATVVIGGMLHSRKKVSLPDVEVHLPSLSDKDRDDIRFGVEQGVDFFAASFVRTAEDVQNVRQVISDCGGDQSIIAKIESRQGVNNLRDILEAADGLMVARGDLGVEMPAEEVPVIQKRIIKAANIAGKPVITATQMLESMISSPTPTRAEASDVTNAIFDGTDAVMLSGETAVGSYPLEAVRFLARTARIAEEALDYETILADGLRYRRPVITDAISYASCATAAHLSAAAIITATTSGATARRVARYRPKTPIIAFSSVPETLRKMKLIRGVLPRSCTKSNSLNEQIHDIIHMALEEKLIDLGERVVITAGLPLHTEGTTNTLKVLRVNESYLEGLKG